MVAFALSGGVKFRQSRAYVQTRKVDQIRRGVMKTSKAKLSRRQFLFAAGAGGAATAAAIVARKDSDGAAPQEKALESKKGYQLTEHVRNYYRTAKV
jgi:hypothetical protein